MSEDHHEDAADDYADTLALALKDRRRALRRTVDAARAERERAAIAAWLASLPPNPHCQNLDTAPAAG